MEIKRLLAENFPDLKIGCSYRYVYSDTEYFRPHCHDYFELFIMLEGEAKHLVNGEELNIKQGNLVFIRPNDVHDYLSKNGKKFSFLNIMLTKNTTEELFKYLGEDIYEKLLSPTLPPCILLTEFQLEDLNLSMQNICSIDVNAENKLKTALRVFILNAVTLFIPSTKTKKQDDAPEWFTSLLEEMKKNGNYVYGVEKMMSLTDKTREHVSRCMKKYTGKTVSEFINGLRLQYVANMLKNSNYSITYIIYESGFNSVTWALESFKKEYGVTMSEYRRNYQ